MRLEPPWMIDWAGVIDQLFKSSVNNKMDQMKINSNKDIKKSLTKGKRPDWMKTCHELQHGPNEMSLE